MRGAPSFTVLFCVTLSCESEWCVLCPWAWAALAAGKKVCTAETDESADRAPSRMRIRGARREGRPERAPVRAPRRPRGVVRRLYRVYARLIRDKKY